MSEEKYKQSRKPINPLEGFDDAEAVMNRIKEMEKHIPAIDPMTRQPTEMPFAVQGNMPPEIAQMFNKDGKVAQQRQSQENQMQQYTPSKPSYNTNNPKLNELLEGIKQQTANYEETRLPSLSKFYLNGEAPEGGIIHVRPMTGHEEEILGTQRLLKKGHAINMIFKNCVKENIHPEKWLTIDRTHLLIYLRGISMGPIYQVELRCPLCAHRYDANLDLDALSLKFCPNDFGPDNLKGVLPTSGYKFSYHLPTVGDEALINNYADKKKKDSNSMSADDTFVWRTALLLEEIEGFNEHSGLMTLIENLHISDVNHLRNVIGDTPFGVNTKIPQWCPNCFEEFEVDLPFEANFFYPQPKKGNQTRASN